MKSLIMGMRSFRQIVQFEMVFKPANQLPENDSIEIKFLPPYSPELNPDEQVWNHLKQRLAKIMITNKKTMQQKIQNIMQSIQKKKGMVQSYFKLDDTRYIIT